MENISSVDQSGLLALISAVSKIPVTVNGVDYAELLSEEHREVKVPRRFYAGLEKVFGWVGANPYNSDRRQLAQLLYTQIVDSEDADRLPSPTASESFLRELTEGTNKNIFLKGKRGAGKTAATNLIINQQFDRLTAAGYTFFRADIAKLHELINVPRERESPKRRSLSIADYMALHAFMVALEHCGKGDPALQLFTADSVDARSETSFVHELKRAEHNSSALVIGWTRVREAYLGRNREKRGDKDLTTYINNCSRQDELNHGTVAGLWGAFQKFIHHSTIKIILIFDGVDNLRIDEYLPTRPNSEELSSRKWYGKYLEELAEFLLNGEACLAADKYLYVLRPDTCSDLLSLTKTELHSHEIPREFHVQGPSVEQLLRLKTDSALQDPGLTGYVAALTESERRNAYSDRREGNEHIARFRWFFDEFSRQLCLRLDEVRTELNDNDSLSGISKSTISDVLKVIFNGNVRSFSRNLIRSFAQVDEYSMARLRLTHPTDSQGRLNELISHRQQVLESSLLGGNTYFVGNRHQNAKGRWCPNFFEFVTHETARKWNGLVSLRILQMLPSADSFGDLTAPTAKEICAQLEQMGYVKFQTQEALFVLIDFGMVQQRSVILDTSGTRVPTYEKTLKGQFIQHMPFRDPAALYLLSTGARLGVLQGDPTDIQARRSKGWLHSEGSPRHFWAAAIKSGVLLVRHIQSAHQEDMALLNSVSARNPALARMNAFLLPNLDHCLESMSIHLHKTLTGMDAEDVVRCEALIKEWLDLLAKSDLEVSKWS